MNKKVLGRGLNTLLPTRSQPAPQPPPPVAVPADAPVTELETSRIVPNPFQPRKVFNQQSLDELAQSIRADGVIQPLVVRRAGAKYELVAGERRWRAAQMVGLTTVPVHVRDMPDERMLEVALIENLQREDLDPIETAAAFHQLSDDFGLSHEEIGLRTGKDRATISNAIRLLQLPSDVQKLIQLRSLTPGHGRALLKLEDPDLIRDYAVKAIANEWSVRTIELLTTRRKQEPQAVPEPKTQDANVRAAIDEMERTLGTRVRIVEKTGGKGKIEIEYFSQDDLDRIYGAITGPR